VNTKWLRRGLVTLGAVAALGFVGTGTANAAVLLAEDFSGYAVGSTYNDGAIFGPWQVEYNGFGYAKIVDDGTGNHQFEQQPKVSTTPSETHAALTLSRQAYTPTKITSEFGTIAQTRTGSAPNPWEVAWLVWNYTDDDHFYSLNLKPNGWEFGKEDPAYPGSQRYLKTGSTPTFPIGTWAHVEVTQVVNAGLPTFTVKVTANGVTTTLATFTDKQRPYLSGKVGMYNEDSRTWFGYMQVQG
jgi:hypothetical protein